MSFGPNGDWLVNVAFPDTLKTAGEFDVTNRAMRLTASGLAGDEVATIQIWVGPNGGNGDGAWVDLFHAGLAVQMDALNTQRTIILIGQYRVVYEGVADVKVFGAEDTNELDNNVIYNFAQPYNASGGGGGGGFTLSANDTDSVDLTYSGTTSSGTLTADVNISADAGNQVSIVGDGLFVPDPGASVFDMVHSDEGADFTVGTTYHGYSVADDDTDPIAATLPAVTGATGQIFVIQSEYDGSSGAHLGVDVDSASTINQDTVAVHMENGQVALFYATDDDWNLVNYSQISTDPTNQLEWLPGLAAADDAGLFVAPPTSVPNIIVPVTTDTVTLAGGAPVNVQIIKPAGTLAALTLDATAAEVDGAIYFVTFTQIISALTHTAQFDAAGLALATATIAGQVMGYVWRDSASKWTRFQ